ncbi:MAG: hypothetical protein M3N29_03870 [Chloroflexota bacterium]|nr:hypothetical protein [Chloroflexota bacterium]
MNRILDFIYLDIQRLRSFASQLFEGVPESRTTSTSDDTHLAGSIEASLPLLLRGTMDTKAVLSAGSSLTSTIHHKLVVEVIAGLRERGYLRDSIRAELPDGAFVLVSGQLQVIDAEALAGLVERMPDVQRSFRTLTGDPQRSNRAERRSRHGHDSDSDLTPGQANALTNILRTFASNSVRIRLLSGDHLVATAIVERDKFVEQLDRLVVRHGHRMAGTWHVLGQVNKPADDPFYSPEGQTLLDIVERDALAPMKLFVDISGTAATITPLAVYREVAPVT